MRNISEHYENRLKQSENSAKNVITENKDGFKDKTARVLDIGKYNNNMSQQELDIALATRFNLTVEQAIQIAREFNHADDYGEKAAA